MIVTGKLNIRNNVKSGMIQELLFRLHGSMDNDNNSISSIYNDLRFNMIPLQAPNNELAEWSEERCEIPCLNVDCEFTKFVLLFYKSHDLFLLPGLMPEGHCKICHMKKQGTLNWSKLKLTGKNEVKIL